MSNAPTPRLNSEGDRGRARGVDRESAWTLIALFALTAPGSLYAIASLRFAPFALGWLFAIPGAMLTMAGLRRRRLGERVGGLLALPSLVLLLITAMLHALAGVLFYTS